MILTDRFNKGFGKVTHTLINDWTWEKIVERISINVNTNTKYLHNFGDGGFTLGGMENDPMIAEVLEFLQPLAPTYHTRAGLYAGIQSNSKTFDLHADPGQHLWIWQILGSTPWQVEDKYFQLEKNDMLYISPGLMHKAIPDMPRASISFSLEKN